MVQTAGFAIALHLGFAVMAPPGAAADQRPFEGLRALVVEPENFWGWDAAVFGALDERRFDVTYAGPEALEDAPALARYDLVASNIRRSFTPAQVANLSRYVEQGGAFYGSWGGPMSTGDLLRDVCHVSGTRSVRITGMHLLGSTPLARGIGETDVPFPPIVGHQSSGRWEIVAVTPTEGGVTVATDADGNSLGVLGEHGRGRTAVLGFGPENEKYFARPEIGPVMMDNLLGWLLEARTTAGPTTWPGVVQIAIPVRAEVLAVYVKGEQVPRPDVREFGSIKRVAVDVKGIGVGEQAAVRVTYRRLPPARDVETLIHLPWGSFPRSEGPLKLAEWLASVHATACQPLLREGDGHAYYKGMPEDTPDPVSVTAYPGNFLADSIAECHKRGIKVIGGIYFESRTTLKRHPDAVVVKPNGDKAEGQACFNNPEGQEYNLATIRHLIQNYDVDGVILDDNFELEGYNCCCDYCKQGFKEYCQQKGFAYEDPSGITGGPAALHWRQYKRQATLDLAAKVSAVAHERNLPAGGWISAGMGAARLAPSFDFLGGMVYTQPPRAARLMLSALGKCSFLTLLWGPSSKPEDMEREVREAIHSGSATVGFWCYPPGHTGSGGFRMADGSYDAIARAFSRVEQDWLDFYRDNLLSGDARFVAVDGKVGAQELTLTVRNTGQRAESRFAAPIHLDALSNL